MKKKYYLESGARGGYDTGKLVFDTEGRARNLAASLVRLFAECAGKGSSSSDWIMTTGVYRKSWQSATHFVAVTVLCDVFDDMVIGPASQYLWKLNDTIQGFKEEKHG